MRLPRGIRTAEAAIALALLVLLGALKLIGDGAGAGTDTYAATDFRSGGYAAFYALLQREGIAVETFERRPAELDRRIDTLIVASPPAGIDADARLDPDIAALRAWVAGGGRLVALGADPFAKPRSPIEREPAPPAGHAAGAPAVRAYGRGEVVMYPEAWRFSNGAIARDGNARLAFALAQPLHAGGTVAFDEAIHGALIDRAWWQALSADERVALGGCALAIVIALAGGVLRLGPAVTVRAAREPASDEFVAAAAALYQRSGARRAALELLAHGARASNVPAAMQLRALAERDAPDDRDVIAGARLAHIIREGT